MKKIEQAPAARHGRDGRPKIGGVYYTRASTLAKTLDDQGNLIGWAAKMAARGVAVSPDLQALAATTDLNDRSRWRDIVDRAKDRAGGNSGADLGTGIHSATEMLDLGQPLDQLPPDLRADAHAYRDALKAAGMVPLAGEMFVVNGELQVAGSFDRLVLEPTGTAAILDLKTIDASRDADYAVKFSAVAWAIQIALYANSKPHDGLFGTGEWSDYGLPIPQALRGYVAVIRRGAATCDLVEVDLTEGLRLARLAAAVRDARKATPARVVAA
jgi:hypothetical protein